MAGPQDTHVLPPGEAPLNDRHLVIYAVPDPLVNLPRHLVGILLRDRLADEPHVLLPRELFRKGYHQQVPPLPELPEARRDEPELEVVVGHERRSR